MSTQTTIRPLIDGAMADWYLYSKDLGEIKNRDVVDKFLIDYVDKLEKSQYDTIFYEFGFIKLINYMDEEVTQEDTTEDLLDFSDQIKKYWVYCAIFKCITDRESYLKSL